MHIHGIDANLLVSLDALLREGSVTRAAERVGLTQSAMSHALSRLRAHLDDPLLVRAGRHMVLTPKAEALAPRVARIVNEMASIFDSADSFRPESIARSFHIKTTDHMLFVLLPAIDQILNNEAPDVDLVVTAMADSGIESLRSGTSDLAIGVFPDVPTDVREQTLFLDRFVCLVRADHPVATQGLTLSRYKDMTHVLVAPRGKPVGIVDQALSEQGIKRRIARSVPHFLIAPFIVSRSDAVVTMSERLSRNMLEILPLAMLEPPVSLAPYPLSMAWHERCDKDPAHRWIRDVLMRAAARLPALGSPESSSS